MLPTMEPVKMDFYPLHTQILFECNEGYERVGPEVVYCREDGSWTEPPPRCSRETCETPTQPAHGDVSWTHLKEGGVASFTCEACYRLEGYRDLRCIDGEWLPQRYPSCAPNVCYPPGEEANSYIVGYNSSQVRYFTFFTLLNVLVKTRKDLRDR